MARTRSLLVALSLAAALVAGCPAPREALRSSPAAPASVPGDAGDGDSGGQARGGSALPLPTPISSWNEPRRRRDPADLCEPVRENLDRAARAIVAADRRADAAGAKTPWDRKTPPKYTKLVADRYALTTAEKAMLAKNGFVVPARLATRGYADALHDIYQSQLPTYVSADAILHSVFRSNDAILEQTETTLMPRLVGVLMQMHDALAKVRDYPPEIARDADVYLTVARSLLAEESVTSALGTDSEASALIASARAASGGLTTVTLFGRPRVIDFSQFAPRGHYAHSEELERWFRATMWLSRLEMNLVSRGSRSSQPGFKPNPEETPREAVLALALADLAERAKVLDELDVFESTWTHFAGRREDVSLRALLALKKQAGITTLSVPDSADKLRARIGSSFQRTAQLHYMPQGSTPLPAIATMLGPRVVADTQAETTLVHAHVADRSMPSFADVAFMLGHDRAKTWLAKDLAAFPALGGKLDAGRALLAALEPTDMYAAWLGAVRGLGVTPPGTLPSFTRTTAFQDYRVNSAIAAYGQIRHNYVLLAGQAYDQGGCEVPEGYVEPALAVYEGLVAYARRGAEAMKAIAATDEDAADRSAYFARLESTMTVLIAIVKDELAGRELSEEERRWLSMVVEIVPPSSDGPGSFDGWYFDLFLHAGLAFDEHGFLADWFSSSNANAVVYAGASNPRLGLFVVDVGGAPRVMVGPVARGFEHVAPLNRRLKDEDAAKLKDLREPWAASYTAPALAAPPLAILSVDGPENGRTFAVRSTRTLGPVTLELLGHHREVIGRATVQVGTGYTKVTVPQKTDEYGERLRVRAGEFSHEIAAGYGDVNEAIGGMVAPEWEAADALRARLDRRGR
ncbi:MAG: DUF3160 domain-containing protein [Labilithrix sp.]|nr:DUF3160 domain-containing protein [Labilithrix sp.]